MPVLAGTDERAWLHGLGPGRSGNLDEYAHAWGPGRVTPFPASGARAGTGAVYVASAALMGVIAPQSGGELFEKVIALPGSVDFGFVLDDRSNPVEVWNTHRATERNLSGISVSGVGGLIVTGASPMLYGPGQSSLYTLAIQKRGSALITNVSTWSFGGESGVVVNVEGIRVVVFSPAMDWSEPFREGMGWKSSVLTGYDGTEQRFSLRTVPRYSTSFRVLTTTSQATRELENLIYGCQKHQYGVPWWPEASPLTSAASMGVKVLPLDTTHRPAFMVGAFALVWASQGSWEVVTIQSVAAGSISLESPTRQDWAAGVRVVPLRRGRLLTDLSLDRPTNWLTAATFSFACEAL